MEHQVRRELVGMIDRALGDDPKQALIAARQLKDEVGWLTERSVALARREGFDWGRIGRLLAVTRQSARRTVQECATAVAASRRGTQSLLGGTANR